MPRRGGDGAAGAEEIRDALSMKGDGAGKGGMFDNIRLARMQPWARDGSQRTDIVAGQIDSSGKFKGITVSGAHIQALLRYFKLSATCLPACMPPNVADMAGALEEGFPIFLVTRGVFGRSMDNGAGPVSNQNQEAVWQAARAARQENPRLLITCIDAPVDLDSDEIEKCLDAPLDGFRELAYQNGVWYIPQVENAGMVASQLRTIAEGKGGKTKQSGVQFNRKKFEWRQTNVDHELWTIVWQPVHEARPAQGTPWRLDLDFTENRKPSASGRKALPSSSETQLKNSLTKADGDADALLKAVDEFLKKGTSGDEDGMKRAAGAAIDASKLFKTKGKKAESAKSLQSAFSAQLAVKDFDSALSTASDIKSLFADLKDKKGEISAVSLAMSVRYAQKDPAAAIKEATNAQSKFKTAKDKRQEAECSSLVVNHYIEEDDYAKALKTAEEARAAFKKDSNKEGEAIACLAMAGAHTALGQYDDAIKDQKAAKDLFKGVKNDELEAAQAICNTQLLKEDGEEALAAAKEMLKIAETSRDKKWESVASQRIALCIPLASSKGKQLTSEQETEIQEFAQRAQKGFAEVGDKFGEAQAQALYAASLIRQGGAEKADQALENAQAAAARFKEAGGGAGMSAALLASAQAHLLKGSTYSAYWNAKQAVKNASYYQDDAIMYKGMDVLSQAGGALDKDVAMGSFVPVVTGDYVTYV